MVLRAENPCINHEMYAAWGPCQGCVHFPFSELIIVSKDNLFSFPYFSSHSMWGNTQWNENQKLRSVRASQILPTTQASCSIKTVCSKPFKAQVLPICFVICPQIHCTNMISTKSPWKQTGRLSSLLGTADPTVQLRSCSFQWPLVCDTQESPSISIKAGVEPQY